MVGPASEAAIDLRPAVEDITAEIADPLRRCLEQALSDYESCYNVQFEYPGCVRVEALNSDAELRVEAYAAHDLFIYSAERGGYIRAETSAADELHLPDCESTTRINVRLPKAELDELAAKFNAELTLPATEHPEGGPSVIASPVVQLSLNLKALHYRRLTAEQEELTGTAMRQLAGLIGLKDSGERQIHNLNPQHSLEGSWITLNPEAGCYMTGFATSHTNHSTSTSHSLHLNLADAEQLLEVLQSRDCRLDDAALPGASV